MTERELSGLARKILKVGRGDLQGLDGNSLSVDQFLQQLTLILEVKTQPGITTHQASHHANEHQAPCFFE